MYTTAAVTLKFLDANIKAAWREVSLLSELWKDVMKKRVPKRLSIPDALETDKQRLSLG